MKCISWNCRGLNEVDSAKLIYAFWLLQVHKPHLLFLCETKMLVNEVVSLFSSKNPSFSDGTDAIGSSGGLVILGWSPFAITCIFKSSNIVLCNILEPNGNNYYVMFCYGAPLVENRKEVWETMLQLLISYPKCLLLGDFNQIELHSDKLGGSSNIQGWMIL